MNTENNSMTISNENEGTIGASFEQYVEDNTSTLAGYNDVLDLVRHAYYSGAKAVFECGTPLSKMAELDAEIVEYLEEGEDVDG